MIKDKICIYEQYPSQMDICFSERCNMECDYCFVDKSNPAKLDFHTIKKAINLFFALPVEHHTITLTTTESLIYPELFRKTLRYIFSSADSKNIRINVVVTTNGILLDYPMRKFLDSLDSRFQLNISLDGKPESHDAHRKLKGSDKRGSFDKAFRNFISIKDKSQPRVIFTITPSEIDNLNENLDFIIKTGFKKFDLFPQMLHLWSREDLIKLEKAMERVVSKFNVLEGYDLRLLNRLWGHSHYAKILLGCDGNFYLFEMILVINHKERKPYLIGDPNLGIDLKKRFQMFKTLFAIAEKSGGRCPSCPLQNICFVPLPLMIWCKTKGYNFQQYLDNFCRISRMFVRLSQMIKKNLKNELDCKKLTQLEKI